MLTGVVPAVLNVSLLYEDRHKPGVRWFLWSMLLGGLWALVFATFTLVRDPGVTLALANVFWTIPPAASVAMFLLAYEYVSSTPPPRLLVGALCVPILVMFVLSWSNPANLIYHPSYHVDSAGVLHFPQLGGVLKVVVVKIYGYLLFTIAAGMLLGEIIRTSGTRRRELSLILLAFSTIAITTLVKVANLVPIYFDPTAVVFTCSGLAFALSTRRRGFLKMVTIAREQAFEQVADAIFILDPSGTVVDANDQARELFGPAVVHADFASLLDSDGDADSFASGTVSIAVNGNVRYYSVRRSPVVYFRGTEAEVVVLTDITAVKNREQDLDLFKQVLTRIFRHNMRNDLNVVQIYADQIASNTTGDIHAHSRRILAKTNGLLEKTIKAKTIEDIFTEDRTQQLSLAAVVQRAVETVDSAPVSATIHNEITDCPINAHPKLQLAIRELIENAVVHNTAAEPKVRLFTAVEGTTATLYVDDNGPGIPESEVHVLDAEAETDLRHGSGIGLWLVHWIVKRSNGEIVILPLDQGSRIGLRLPVVETRDR